MPAQCDTPAPYGDAFSKDAFTGVFSSNWPSRRFFVAFYTLAIAHDLIQSCFSIGRIIISNSRLGMGRSEWHHESFFGRSDCSLSSDTLLPVMLRDSEILSSLRKSRTISSHILVLSLIRNRLFHSDPQLLVSSKVVLNNSDT